MHNDEYNELLFLAKFDHVPHANHYDWLAGQVLNKARQDLEFRHDWLATLAPVADTTDNGKIALKRLTDALLVLNGEAEIIKDVGELKPTPKDDDKDGKK